MVGLLPLAATTRLTAKTLRRLPELGARLRWFLTNRPEYAEVIGARRLGPDGRQQRLLSMVGPEQVVRLLARMLDPDEFLSDVRPAYAVPRAPGQAVLGRPSAGRSSPSATSRPSRPAACSAATRTGAGRSGCRRTSC